MRGWHPPSAGDRLAILRGTRSVAVVGASSNRSRPSHFVATYLLSSSTDFVVWFVNPRETSILGRPAYPSLDALPDAPDLVDVFRRAEDLPGVAREAVAVGLERTGRIVTAAALLFAVAIGAFTTSKLIFIKELGLGTALAVLIDASVVRALLVPSLMELLGKWNWWAPAPLRRLHERIGLSDASPEAPRTRPLPTPSPTG